MQTTTVDRTLVAQAAAALRENADELFHQARGFEAAGKTDYARSTVERRIELLRIAGALDGTIVGDYEMTVEEEDRRYQTQRGAILGTAVGRARLALAQGDTANARTVLDQAAADTRKLLEDLLPLFDTGRLSLPEEQDA